VLNPRRCDICERTEADLARQAPDGTPALEIDGDGLWICFHCRHSLTDPQVGETEAEAAEDIASLVGKSAGAICRTLNLPYVPPFQSISDAASKIAYDEDLYMSAWSFVAQWSDGTSVWRSEDRVSVAIVAPDGSIRIESG
jgi:hypothetical protein